MGVGGISISDERRSVVQFTKSYTEGRLVIGVAVRGTRSGFFTSVFRLGLWLCVLSLPLAMSILLMLVTHTIQLNKKQKNRLETFKEATLYLYGNLCYQGQLVKRFFKIHEQIFW